MKLGITSRVLLVLLLVAGSAGAQDLSGIAGAYADIGLGTRPLGMGGAFSAVANDENAARWNPAALATSQGRCISFTWANQFNLIPYNYLSGNFPLNRFGLGYYIETAGDDVLRENTLAIGFGVSPDKPMIGALGGLLAKVPGLSFGTTLKMRYASFGNNSDGGEHRVDGSAIGFGFDFGFLYNLPAFDKVNFSMVWRDLGNMLMWDTSVKGSYNEGVPVGWIMGVAYQPNDRALMTFDLRPELYGDTNTRIAAGIEYKVFKIIALRGGFAQDLGTLQFNRDWTFGLGVDTKIKNSMTLNVGISYLIDELVNTPRVGMAFYW